MENTLSLESMTRISPKLKRDEQVPDDIINLQVPTAANLVLTQKKDGSEILIAFSSPEFGANAVFTVKKVHGKLALRYLQKGA